MTAPAPESRTFADGGRNATPPSTTGPAAPGVKVTVRGAGPTRHPRTGQFIPAGRVPNKTNGGHKPARRGR